jgi:hypothetical protein
MLHRRRTKKARRIWLIAALGAGLLLAGCGSSSAHVAQPTTSTTARSSGVSGLPVCTPDQAHDARIDRVHVATFHFAVTPALDRTRLHAPRPLVLTVELAKKGVVINLGVTPSQFGCYLGRGPSQADLMQYRFYFPRSGLGYLFFGIANSNVGAGEHAGFRVPVIIR